LARTFASPCLGCKPKARVATIDFLAKQMLGIVSFQIETNNFVFLVGFFTKFRRCHLHLNNFGFLNFKKLRSGIGNYEKKVNDRPTLVNTLMQRHEVI